MLINPVELIENEQSAILQSRIEYSGKQQELWYSVDKKYSRYLTNEKLDGFLVGVLPLAMRLKEDITVRGGVSEKLYHNLTNYYIHINHLEIPYLKPVRIIPDTLVDGKQYDCEGAVGTGFTGGIDSFFTIFQYLLAGDVLPNYKITHFIFTNVGSHGHEKSLGQASRVFNSRYEILRGWPEELGIDFIKIDSNLNEFYNDPYTSTYQARHLSCPLLLQKLFRRYYYASGARYRDSIIGITNDISDIDALAVHLLSTETLEFILSGSQYSRVEKTKQLLAVDVTNRLLNVCVANQEDGKNCSKCSKCRRTLLTLEILGVIDRYSEVFCLDKWKKIRNLYIIGQILGKDEGDPLKREIKEYAASTGYSFPAWKRALGLIIRLLPNAPYNLAKKYYMAGR